MSKKEKVDVIENIDGNPYLIALRAKPDERFMRFPMWSQRFDVEGPLQFTRNVSREALPNEPEVVSDKATLIGKAKLTGQTRFAVLGVPRASTREMPVSIGRISPAAPEAPAGETPDRKAPRNEYPPWFAVVGWWRDEDRREEFWYLETYLPPDVYDPLEERVRAGKLKTLHLTFDLPVWINELDRHAPSSEGLTWYLRPSGTGDPDFPEPAMGSIKGVFWSEHKTDLAQAPTGSPKPETPDLDVIPPQVRSSSTPTTSTSTGTPEPMLELIGKLVAAQTTTNRNLALLFVGLLLVAVSLWLR